MKLPKIKLPNIKNFLTRDAKGRFSEKNVLVIKTSIVTLVITIIFLAGWITNLKVAEFFSKNGLQNPYVISHGGDTVLSITKRPVVYQLPPVVIISPIVEPKEVEKPKLGFVEQKILDKFGEKNYRVFRALGKCESGLRAEVWEKPVLKQFGYTLKDMFDVDKNIEVAYWIFDRDNDGQGSIAPWMASTTKCFADELMKGDLN